MDKDALKNLYNMCV